MFQSFKRTLQPVRFLATAFSEQTTKEIGSFQIHWEDVRLPDCIQVLWASCSPSRLSRREKR